ncbi:MAG: 3-phosphoshikimate 1-carboxyvinyltransferase [Eubacterium sp.]|nr:3-phosphoshikimate 1-carboxyvinyltransferase [Eubacterium sp.]
MNIDVRVPGSKSMTNRALLLAALAEGESVLRGVGMSDDSRVFMEALTALGFDLAEKYGADGSIAIRVTGHGGELPQKKAKVYVGSAGTAARFLTAMMGLSDGCYEVTSSDQMKARPMRELLEVLEFLGAQFTFHESPYAFPFTVTGRRHADAHTADETLTTNGEPLTIPLNIDRSSQFLSALLLCAPMTPDGYHIRLTGTREARSYVKITEQMMHKFAAAPPSDLPCDIDTRNLYAVPANLNYNAREYDVEPDISAACYFYAMAAACTGTAHVAGVTRANTQGDMRFLDVLAQMGCMVAEDAHGEILVTRTEDSPLHGITIDMSDFSDQTMTLAAIAPFADTPTTITGVAHIRGQESNRIEAIVTELTRLGIRCEEHEDGMTIYPAADPDQAENETRIQTYNDHRMAMAFAVTGMRMRGISIDNPACCRKTFDNYFEILQSITR